MAKKDRWTEPKLPEVEEVEEEIVVEETVVEPEPEPEPEPTPEPEPEPAPAAEPDADGKIYIGYARGRNMYQWPDGKVAPSDYVPKKKE